MWKYHMPVKIFLGFGTLGNITDEMDEFNFVEKVMIITGKTSAEKYGHLDILLSALKGRKVKLYNRVDSNPDIALFNEAAKEVRKYKPDVIIGLGGGSVLDVGKAAALLATNNLSIEKCLKDRSKIRSLPVPFIAVPTTSGTGSELTPWSTVWDYKKKKKMSLEHPFMYAEAAVVDPYLTMTMPSDITASTGLDALSHAVEALFSPNLSPVSAYYALLSIELITNNFNRVLDKRSDRTARYDMSMASLFAGLAFSNTKTGASHALSYSLTMNYNIPHGVASALTLPALVKLNYGADKQIAGHIFKSMNVKTASQAAEKIRKFIKKGGFSYRLRDYGVTEKGIKELIKDALSTDRIKNNVKRLTKSDINKILKEVW
ncbi:MAG: iron-containing alcohol dehydrogenase [Armatimonadota bacterium]